MGKGRKGWGVVIVKNGCIRDSLQERIWSPKPSLRQGLRPLLNLKIYNLSFVMKKAGLGKIFCLLSIRNLIFWVFVQFFSIQICFRPGRWLIGDFYVYCQFLPLVKAYSSQVGLMRNHKEVNLEPRTFVKVRGSDL
ncbi:hypothetical protein DDZ16_16635 [Marinilabilia rubra]|uniref:Uncharacterized protein n=1 Tax=Marinilabilia rubra TaxID=2162893 RepID=A0A2U2B5B4_9BACT|nr:hypothetical protein DDZ16_16635 [Marinilabilia rubra]